MDSNSEEKNQPPRRVGVYICHCGGNISDHVDVNRVAEEVQKIPGVVVAHTNLFMCSDPGQQLIQEDIQKGRIDRVVVASCAPGLHELTFRGAIQRAGLSPYLYEHANIREQVSWVHHGEKATGKAATLVAAAVAKARNLEPLSPIRVDATRRAVVIGGGVAGLRAAIDLSRRGLTVTLIEISPFLGGNVAKLDTLAPTGESAARVVEELGRTVMANPGIEIHTCSQVVQCEGYVGNFTLKVQTRAPEPRQKTGSETSESADNLAPGAYVPLRGFFPVPIPATAATITVTAGVIVLATGFEPYVPRARDYGYLTCPGVITLPDLIARMADQPPSGGILTYEGRPIRRVAFIHCVGSRQIPGLHEPDGDGNLNEYCSRTCCSAVLQAAARIREAFPQTRVFDLYRDIRTYGRGQEELYEKASSAGVLFLRFEADAPPLVESAGSGSYPLRIRVKDTLTFGEELIAEVDLVVLAVGMVPRPIANLVEMLKLPLGTDRFVQEVHPKLRPVEVAKSGILLAGTCQAPMDVGESCAAAQAAAAKATALLIKGYVELDPFVAEVNATRCTGCGACAAACPIAGAIILTTADDSAKARVKPALCKGCGICVPPCPETAIDINGWTLRQYEAMVDAIVAAQPL